MAKPSLRRAGDFPRQLRHIECFRATHNIIKLKAIGYNHSIGKFRIGLCCAHWIVLLTKLLSNPAA
jgi:hypothetical protein